MYSNASILFNQVVKESLPSKNDYRHFKISINYSNYINFTGMIWTSQGFLNGGVVSSDFSPTRRRPLGLGCWGKNGCIFTL